LFLVVRSCGRSWSRALPFDPVIGEVLDPIIGEALLLGFFELRSDAVDANVVGIGRNGEL
jgi:hypothetical protein